MQDTIKPYNIVLNDTLKPLSDSSLQNRILPDDIIAVHHKPFHSPEVFITFIDTSAVCVRNSVIDFTFYDSLNFISENKLIIHDRFPFLFIAKNTEKDREAKASLALHLKSGEQLPAHPFHNDWLIGIIIFTAFIYSLIRTSSRSYRHELTRFFLFRGLNDPASRDLGGLFNWQSTLLNLISFFNLGLFVYCTAMWYNHIPAMTGGFLIWLISVGIIITAITLRHFVCVMTGSISDEREVFREYLLVVYQSYRFSAIILLIIVILILYTHIFPLKMLFMTGFIVLILMYLIRVIRLFLIFINRNISIFYLILYLCALEFLPVLIIIKYFTGLV